MEELLQLGSAELERHAAGPLHQHRRFSLARGEHFANDLHHSRRGAGAAEEAHASVGEALCQPSLSLKASMKVTFRSPVAPRASRMSSAVRDKLTISIGLEALRLSSRQAVR
eukprot:TRINITY_DN16317_c0_g1_i1.p2 TRINITY_DN16317_c0_g1~~TRINITY_DN16317_c0_g1_i1.p2  ORF type:complete len:112 (+),score=11.52 TRINITY_DN16317_c0_g1_i1:36-371(+)